jgi:hypothetical protein
MNKEIFEIFADEAWTNSSPPLRRYWCFLAGVMGSKADLDRLDKALKEIKVKHGYRAEAKWSKITGAHLGCYKELVDCFFEKLLALQSLKFRQMFLDRSFIHPDSYQQNPANLYDLGTQFKLYYQFIKHHFDIQNLPIYPGGIKIFLRLDDHSSQRHKDSLETFVKDLPRIIQRPDIEFEVTFLNSGHSERIQICDLLMGAAGSHGNKMQEIRIDGRRGMTSKQKIRDEFCRHVYGHLRKISCAERNAGAFNWFESTGGMAPEDRPKQKIRIWKFVPKTFYKDKGWENDHLAKDGSYVGPDIDFSNLRSL